MSSPYSGAPPGSPADLEQMYFGRRPAPAGYVLGFAAGAVAAPDQAVTPPARVIFPPDLERPGDQSQDIFASNTPGTAVGPGPVVWVVPATLVTTLTPNHVGRIASFGVQVTPLLATSAISFILRVNGGAGYPTLLIPAAPLTTSAFAWNIYLKLPKGAQFDVLVSVADAAVYTVQAYYAGWQYPAEYDAIYARGLSASSGGGP